ncbi:MAG: redoxin domain-containing protein [Alphaproteobacteria bacterium]|nr:redoxin domain-containing protein [Alphaproteobacteria bacterium]
MGYLFQTRENQEMLEAYEGELAADDQAATVLKAQNKSTIQRGSIDIGGEFTLVNQDGEEVTHDDFSDSYKLIFFGFTYCPAVCPTELQKMKLVLDELGPLAEKFTPIFISVDPERDTVPVVKEYVAQFHPKLVGLTGSVEQIEEVKKAYRVYASKVENDMMDEYMVDHSSFMYFMDKGNKMLALYPSTDTALEIAEDIKARKL